MPVWEDPVLRAWDQARAESERSCPKAADIVVTAVSGSTLLSAPAAQHLLHERCERCEARLASAWRHTPPLPHVLTEALQWPTGGALRSALDAHIASCSHAACELFAAQAAAAGAAAAAERPAADASSAAVIDVVRAYLKRRTPALALAAASAVSSAGGIGLTPLAHRSATVAHEIALASTDAAAGIRAYAFVEDACLAVELHAVPAAWHGRTIYVALLGPAPGVAKLGRAVRGSGSTASDVVRVILEPAAPRREAPQVDCLIVAVDGISSPALVSALSGESLA